MVGDVSGTCLPPKSFLVQAPQSLGTSDSTSCPSEGLGCLFWGRGTNSDSCWGSRELRQRLKYCHPHSTPPWFPRSPWPSPPSS